MQANKKIASAIFAAWGIVAVLSFPPIGIIPVWIVFIAIPLPGLAVFIADL
jgi:hypothetical protein